MKFRPFLILELLFVLIILSACSGSYNKSSDLAWSQPDTPPLTASLIDSLDDLDLLFAVFQDLVAKLDEDYERQYEIVRSWNESRQAIYMTWLLDAEVNNGGHNQFYFNSSGQFHLLLPDALRLIGATKHAALMERANAIYAKENRKITEHQDGSLEGFSKSYDDNPLNPLDDEFYEMEGEHLLTLQTSYIKANKEAFLEN